jgi:hypothetical protein
MTAWDSLGAVSYTLSYALLESLLLFLCLFIPFILVPKRWREDYALPLVVLAVLELTIAALVVQFNPDLFLIRRRVIAILGLSYGLSAGLLTLLLIRFPKLRRVFQEIPEHLQILTYVYLSIDIIAVVIVLVRNVFPT